jgi:hypothetical protein
VYSPDWSVLSKEDKLDILHIIRNEYFVNEKRLDRISHLMKIWDFGLKYVDEHEWAMGMLDLYAQYMNEHKWTFRDEVSRHGLKAFHPQNWYPVGRGRVWDLIHGGIG